MIVSALTRDDVANYVSALFFVYTILILASVTLSWIAQFRPIPYNLTLRAVIGFVEETTDPFLAMFRRVIPRIGPIDISPMIAILTIWIVGGVVVALIQG